MRPDLLTKLTKIIMNGYGINMIHHMYANNYYFYQHHIKTAPEICHHLH
jgi:hypothetical protein